MAGQDISGMFDGFINNSQEIITKAIKSAASKAQNDVIQEAQSCLQKYYSNYSPRIYRRTYRLKRVIFPYWADRGGKGSVSVEVGVQYKASGLKGAYRSNSRYHQSGGSWIDAMHRDDSPNNGLPQPDWILDNYIHGIHPWAQTDGESTDELMEKFFENELPGHIGQYIESELFNLIISKL